MGFDRFLERDRSMILAYDQGIEHGPTDFNGKNVDPSFIMEIAEKGRFNGIVFQKGIAEKYYNGKVPLILKVNGKTNLLKGEPLSRQNCSVEYAASLGAKAVGYTIYPGSAHESIMLQEFGRIQEEARKHDLAVVVWVYPRGESIKDDTAKDIVAYAARVGLELGADAVKIKYTGDPITFSWAVKSAGKARVLMSGGPKTPTEEVFLQHVKGVLDAGGTGLAVGRNVWQHDEPLKMASALRTLVIERKSLEDAIKIVKG
ncbi:MAG: class I fructose-bisphosphate aldolase [Nitrososphaeria archaeon]